mmetsp:Transcript_66822/g.186540  ORF Transcript_66822/g.186540 Transcript_66822/m.186540 type:complete len:212 (+) Transcript_66822:1712-2347(+)
MSSLIRLGISSNMAIALDRRPVEPQPSDICWAVASIFDLSSVVVSLLLPLVLPTLGFCTLRVHVICLSSPVLVHLRRSEPMQAMSSVQPSPRCSTTSPSADAAWISQPVPKWIPLKNARPLFSIVQMPPSEPPRPSTTCHLPVTADIEAPSVVLTIMVSTTDMGKACFIMPFAEVGMTQLPKRFLRPRNSRFVRLQFRQFLLPGSDPVSPQ